MKVVSQKSILRFGMCWLLGICASLAGSTVLADVNGARTPVSDIIGENGKAVVVFLRHLG